MLTFLYYLASRNPESIGGLIKSSLLRKYIVITLLLPIVIFYIINPYAVTHFRSFLLAQQTLFGSAHDFVGTNPLKENFYIWMSVLKTDYFFVFSILMTPFCILLGFFIKKSARKKLYFINLLSAIVLEWLFIYVSRYYVYLLPAYTFYILNVTSILYFISNIPGKWKMLGRFFQLIL